jgi:maltodextrin utilization protein YvdJ
MSKTLKNKNKNKNKNKSLTNRNINNRSLLQSFQKEITIVFLEILLMVKLYHWKTTSYATHKATDELYSKINENTDKFIEVLLGKTGYRTDLTSEKNIKLIDLSSSESLKREVEAFKGYLVSLNDNRAMKQMTNTDLYNIRDEILGDMNQFLYLLTFK